MVLPGRYTCRRNMSISLDNCLRCETLPEPGLQLEHEQDDHLLNLLGNCRQRERSRGPSLLVNRLKQWRLSNRALLGVVAGLPIDGSCRVHYW